MPQSGVVRTDSPAVASPRPSAHVYNRREEDVEQEGREHAALTKPLFRSEPPRAHLVVEPHACSHAIVEMTNDPNQFLWHAKTGEYCPEIK